MTGTQLLDKLAASGTGQSKIDFVRATMTDNTVLEVLSILKANKHQGTVDKACKMLVDAGETVPGLLISEAPALRAELAKCQAENERLRTELRNVKSHLAKFTEAAEKPAESAKDEKKPAK